LEEDVHRTLAISILCVPAALGLCGCDTNRPTETKPAVEAVVQGDAPAADEPAGNFEVSLADPDLKVGTAGTLTVQVVPKGGFKVNKEFPWRAALTGGAGVQVPSEELGSDKWKLSEKAGSLEVPVTVTETGDREVKGKLNFSVCNDDRCDVIRDHEVSWKVAAK
jgi:hypothetical protein